MSSFAIAPRAARIAPVSLVLVLLAGLTAACGDASGSDGAGGEDGQGGGTTGSTGGSGGAGGAEPCTCAEGEVAVDACTEGLRACEPKTCGATTIGCVPTLPCENVACTGSNLPGAGCADVGAECQTIDCHGNTSALYLCTEEQLWTSWDDLYFSCGDLVCSVGAEYCQDISDAGINQTWACLPIPDGCTYESFCDCDVAYDVCPDAQCASYGSQGWVMSCW